RRRRRHLAALDALRIMTFRTDAPWRVCGLGFSLLEDSAGEVDSEHAVARDDFLVLVSPREQVLFDVGARRAFKVDRAVGQVLEVVLGSPNEEVAMDRLERGGMHPDPRSAISAVRQALGSRGVQLGAPALEGAQA
ncbi:MAG: hypothetical protein M3063_17350, partial [Actinomycetota bacterium]|nr:hypothetical protein [Actinomycetota bacterium]